MTIGSPLPHDAATLHVTGRARYVDDQPLPKDILHLAFGLSEIARGRILKIDLSEVLSSEGVFGVLTAKDLPYENDTSPGAKDEPLLAESDVYYIGQPVFLVMANSHIAARKAARKAKLEYETDTPILTIQEALDADSRFEEGPRIYQKGDAEAAIIASDFKLSGTLMIGGQEHFYLEGQAALAIPSEDDEITVHSSTQHPSEVQHKVADALGFGMHQVRVEVRRMGGGFGGKESQANGLAIACAVAAMATDRPCKMRYDRDDDFFITGKRHEFKIEYEVGFDKTGKINGLSFIHYVRCGWSQDLSLPVSDRAMLHSDNAYSLDHCRIESHRLRTNMQSATAFRGFGGPQGMLGIERVIDHISHHLGLDPLNVRQRNYYKDAKDINPNAKDTQTTPYGMKVKDFVLNAMTDEIVKTSDYHKRRKDIEVWNLGNSVLKRGIALTPVKFGISFTLTHLNQAGALVHLYQDGTVRLNHGGTEMGQGLFQKVSQVAAKSFGVDLASIKITATDTDKVPNTSATAASSGSDLNGMAVKLACETIRHRMTDFLAKYYQEKITSIRFAGGSVHIGTHEMSFPSAVQLCYQNRISLSATGFYKTPNIFWDRIKGDGRPFFYFAHGVSVSEVVIDTLTGENRLLRTDLLHDAGASLNPSIDIGQVEGGYVQGVGWLTTEELVWDHAGKLMTHAPSTYKIPVSSDRPDIFNVTLWENENSEETIYRSKAVGEPPLMLGFSAFFALSHAASFCGNNYPDLNTPATHERLFWACERVEHGD
ncbi:MAG: xanthine dehydrogenase molybdopterin binding subunit [Aestuariivita sp.]|nr:xanthine dehydrogenase molybdopterin binding subunit [Aestuariivita sp.]